VTGEAAWADTDDPAVAGTRAMLTDLGSQRASAPASVLQTVGAKGWDGFAVIVNDKAQQSGRS
jgi:hypothetical protein